MIYIIHQKSKVFQKFQTYKSLIKNHIGWKVKTLRSNNGGEYASNDFKRFCETRRILQHNTTPYTLEQNGVFECKSWTLVEFAYIIVSHIDTTMCGSLNF